MMEHSSGFTSTTVFQPFKDVFIKNLVENFSSVGDSCFVKKEISIDLLFDLLSLVEETSQCVTPNSALSLNIIFNNP